MICTIKVTQEHIRKGKRRDAYKHPIALAIRDKLAAPLKIFPEFVAWEGMHFCTKLPVEAQKFIEDYDNGYRKVEPFEFELALPEIIEQ